MLSGFGIVTFSPRSGEAETVFSGQVPSGSYEVRVLFCIVPRMVAQRFPNPCTKVDIHFQFIASQPVLFSSPIWTDHNFQQSTLQSSGMTSGARTRQSGIAPPAVTSRLTTDSAWLHRPDRPQRSGNLSWRIDFRTAEGRHGDTGILEE